MPAACDPRDNRNALRPPQFGLRMLMIAVSLLCLLFAIMAAVGALWSSMLLMFLLLVGAHVLGNVVGTQLRDHASGPAADADPWIAQRHAAPEIDKDHKLTCKTGLSGTMIAITVCGAILGGSFGGVGLSWLNWQRINMAGMVLATFSSAILGGFLGFLASTFWLTLRGAWSEAIDKVELQRKESTSNVPSQPSPPPLDIPSA